MYGQSLSKLTQYKQMKTNAIIDFPDFLNLNSSYYPNSMVMHLHSYFGFGEVSCL